MTMHLSPDDIAAAVDGTLGAAARSHLETCSACRDAVAELSALVADVKSAPVPEPSPLFWDHLSARVREATALEATPDRRLWPLSRPMLALGGVAAVAAVAFLWSAPSHDRAATAPAPVATTSGERPTDPDVEWETMSELAGSMTVDDVRRATAPAPDRGGVLSELSDDERAAFVALLRVEMGEVQ
jgi:hypothetical protein